VAVSPTLAPARSAAVKFDAQRAEPAPGVPQPAPAVGAAESAGHLYEDYYDRIFGYCLYQLGSREEAEDAAQTTFMWAFRGLRRGVVPRSEASWLFAIAQNACRARHRARARGRQREVLSDPVTLADMSPAPQAEADALMGLEDALERMPELQRRAILLREWRGLSYKEIAAELELSGAAVETLIFRARRSLAELLGRSPTPKRARKHALDLGSFLAGLKSFFGAGSAAKLAAGVAAVVAATTVAVGSVELARSDRASPAKIAPAQVAPQVGHSRSGVGLLPPQAKGSKPSAGMSKTPAAPGPTGHGSVGTQLGQTIGQTGGSLPVVGDVVNGLPVDTATGAVDDLVSTVTDGTAPVTDTLP
jgi:RNA polymerase sigma-70 factor (ECF subfamily)